MPHLDLLRLINFTHAVHRSKFEHSILIAGITDKLENSGFTNQILLLTLYPCIYGKISITCVRLEQGGLESSRRKGWKSPPKFLVPHWHIAMLPARPLPSPWHR